MLFVRRVDEGHPGLQCSKTIVFSLRLLIPNLALWKSLECCDINPPGSRAAPSKYVQSQSCWKELLLSAIYAQHEANSKRIIYVGSNNDNFCYKSFNSYNGSHSCND